MNWPMHVDTYAHKKVRLIVDTQERAYEVVSRNPLNLKFCPYRYRTQELCEWALRANPLCIGYIPENVLTQEHCNWAVNQNYMAYKFVKEIFQTEEMLLYVVEKNPMEIFSIPDNLVTYPIIKKAVWLDGSVYPNLPQWVKTKELEELALSARNNPYKRQIFVTV